jgi:hypothetical protein
MLLSSVLERLFSASQADVSVTGCVGVYSKQSICDALRCPISSPEHLYYIHVRNKGTACTIVASSNQEEKVNAQQRNKQKSCLWQQGDKEQGRQK